MKRKINQSGRNQIAEFLLSYHKNGIFCSRDKDIVNSYAEEAEKSAEGVVLLSREQSRTQSFELLRLENQHFEGGDL
jgi:hypothetical protein